MKENKTIFKTPIKNISSLLGYVIQACSKLGFKRISLGLSTNAKISHDRQSE
jgi:hypothetical protein